MGPGRGGRLAGAGALACILCLLASSLSAAEPSPLIVGGGKANAAGWRFAVALEQKRRLICSGSLIAPTKVLTAAHCVKSGKRRQLSILAGGPWISPRRRAPRIKVTAVAVDPATGLRQARGFQQASMICALGKRIGRIRSRLPFHATSCEGDSGGPLVADTTGGPRLNGAVSAGVFPCGVGGASIYARVATRLRFIERAAGLGSEEKPASGLEPLTPSLRMKCSTS